MLEPTSSSMSLRVVTSSWNVHGMPAKDENLDEWLHLQEDHHDKLADVYVIGLQELPSDPSSLVLDYYIRNDPWTKRILLFLGSKGIAMVESVRMMGLLLLVATKPQHLPFVREIRNTYTKTAFYGLLKTVFKVTQDKAISIFQMYGTLSVNFDILCLLTHQTTIGGTKGAVSIRFELYGESFCFVNNHYVAGDAYCLQRNNHFQSVMSKTLFSNCSSSDISDHRYNILFGDFNYRIENLEKTNVEQLAVQNDFKTLVSNDQLTINRQEGKCFEGYNEMEITFPPTYKFDPQTNDYDTSQKQRTPGYTDRILWKEKSGAPSMEQTAYSSHVTYSLSDHKPISADFTIQVPAMVSAKPTVEFRFDDSFIPWTSEEDGVCIFHVKDYQTSSWDWVGLYTIDFKSPKDYYTYEWSVSGADESGEDGCMILFDDVPEEHGYYMFGYWSRKLECMLGFSEPFLVAPQPEPEEPSEVTVENPPDMSQEAGQNV